MQNKELNKITKRLLTFAKWLLLGLLMGAVGGLVGALFAHSISFVTDLRAQNSFIIYLLPVGGLLSVALYKLLRVQRVGTNQVLESIREQAPVPRLITPAIFLGTIISHLFGASAGREGAALQLGGGVAAFLSRTFKLNERDSRALTVCGMAAFFSALFGTPLGAFAFALEVVSVGSVCLLSVFPTLVASLTAYYISHLCLVEPERFDLPPFDGVDLTILWQTAIVATVGALVSIAFCGALHLSEKLFAKAFKNRYLRICVGGALLLVLTLLVGSYDYNGSGIGVIHSIFSGHNVGFEAFVFKIIFTCITVAAGFKGGEIVPTFFIGATLGCAMAGVIGLNPMIGAAIGMIVLFSGVTNCPFAAFILATEMFSSKGMLYFAIAVIIALVMSGNTGLYPTHHSWLSIIFRSKKTK